MAFPVLPSDTTTMSLDDVLTRLNQHEIVAGILLMGSTGTGQLTPTSDYDITLVLAELPVPARLITTWINGRFAEVYCTTVEAMERIAADPGVWPADTSEEEVVVRWLRTGTIVHDRTGLLQRAAAAARQTPPSLSGELSRYQAWWTINYNVVHMRRYLASDDPRSHAAARLRFLYSLMEVVGHYFTVRQIPWEGEKAAITHFMEHDPHFLDLLDRAMAETELESKRRLYEELAQLTLAPVGGLWTSGVTSVNAGPGFGTGVTPAHDPTVEDAQLALGFWHDLVADDGTRPSKAPHKP